MKRLFVSFYRYVRSLFIKIRYSDLVEMGAQIVDVRTSIQYANDGCIKDSINIPLDDLRNQLSKLDKEKPIIICCENGLRSGLAKNILKVNGFEHVYKGGSWTSLKNKLKK